MRQLRQRDAHLFLVGLGLRLDRHRDHRLRELHALQRDRSSSGHTGCHRSDVFQTDGRGDIAGAHFLDFFTVVGVHLQHTTDALFLALDRVVDRVARLQHAGIDAEERQGADERVGRDLECQRSKRRIVVAMALDLQSRPSSMPLIGGTSIGDGM